METLTTNGVTISVDVQFEPDYSKPYADQYVFSYRIRITNHNTDSIQLISRHWYILDSNSGSKEVKGDGVIGKQPIIAPEETYAYTSWCPLSTPLGKMYGLYHMIRTDGSPFEAQVPSFIMAAPFLLN